MVATWRVQRCRGNDRTITYWDGFLKCNKRLVRGQWLGDHYWQSRHDHCWAHWQLLKWLEIKRSRYAHQVLLTAPIKLARQAFEVQNKYLDYSDWKRDRCSQSATTNYWFTVIDLEVLLSMFICSITRGDFPVFVTLLENIVPWMFSLDHMRWRFSVYWAICCSLEQNNYSMYFCEWVLQVPAYKEVPTSWEHSTHKSSTGTTYQASHVAKQVRV